jgi:hypothetical protein
MTLQDLIDQTRLSLADETVGVRRSWEEMFKYTLRHFSKDTPLNAFDLEVLKLRLCASGIHEPIAAGYLKRWSELLIETGNG